MADSNTIELIDELFQQKILQNHLLVWLDPTLKESDERYQSTIVQFEKVFTEVFPFNDVDACVDFITDIDNQRVFLVLSDDLAPQLVPHIHAITKLRAIYILCSKAPHDRIWVHLWPKIKGLHTDVSILCQALGHAVKLSDQNFISISFLNIDDTKSGADLNQLNSRYVYTHLFKEILLEMKDDDKSRSDLIAHCRKHVAVAASEKKTIDEFERDYCPSKAIWWYTRECFTYQMLNRALRALDADMILKMGFFIRDLHAQIQALHREQLPQYNRQMFSVYRGQGLSESDFQKLKGNPNGLLSFNSFISTSKSRADALFRAESNALGTNTYGVLFNVTIDPTIESIPFADITNDSYFREEEEVLFSMNTVFRIQAITKIDDIDRLYEVHISLTMDDDEALRAMRDETQQLLQNQTTSEKLIFLLSLMGRFNVVEQYVRQELLVNDDLAHVCELQILLGVNKLFRGNRQESEKCLEEAKKILQTKLANDDRQESIYSCLQGCQTLLCFLHMDWSSAEPFSEEVLNKEDSVASSDASLVIATHIMRVLINVHGGNQSKAKAIIEKALHKANSVLVEHHPLRLYCHYFMGSVLSFGGEYQSALQYFDQTLQIAEKFLLDDHVVFFLIHMSIGEVYQRIENYSQALKCYEKAIQVFETVPENIRRIIGTLNSRQIFHVYRSAARACFGLRDYSKALFHYQKQLDVHEKMSIPDYSILLMIYTDMGIIHILLQDSTSAMIFLEKALTICQNAFPEDHNTLITILYSLATIFLTKLDFPTSLKLVEKAHAIRLKSVPSNDVSLATDYQMFSTIYFFMGDHPRSLSHAQKSESIMRATLPNDHPSWVNHHNILSILCTAMGRQNEGRKYAEEALRVAGKCLPPDHRSTAACYTSLGVLHLQTGNFSRGMEYVEQLLKVSKDSVPISDEMLSLFNFTKELTKRMN